MGDSLPYLPSSPHLFFFFLFYFILFYHMLFCCTLFYSDSYPTIFYRIQEIIKVREWIPHIGPLTKVIRLKLFLDIVPSSSEDITRAMRGQPKRLSRATCEKMVGTSFYMFWFRFIPEMFSALSAAFLCSRAFRLFFCSFGCSLFCRLFGFRELN